MRRAEGYPLPVSVWLAAPVLFTAAVLGLTALGGLLLAASWQVTLCVGQFGAAAAVTAGLVPKVGWPSGWLRAALALPYPVAWFAAGLLVGPVAVPTSWALTVGVPVAVLLAVAGTTESPRARWGARGLGGSNPTTD
ncbi:hypothetical protein [Actinokineospora enzanensis]|uniref:hypothetical protein n=1 Tax=Actinokineospora enzanensis TaxID=155975 RepID=UPI000364D116|nr:hypothetical protein [Actinokineospora enzanensis]